jgi:predicted esterase
VYLPISYRDTARWPILFLLDPRGRALVPIQLFRDAAERNGWILVSSYNSLSDGPAQPNADAMNAMLSDARASFSLAHDRLYIGGFSGTARLAWDFAAQLEGRVAGILGASAGTGGAASLLTGPPARLAFFGTAGTLDFNHDEMLLFAKRLEAWELPHRVRIFPGPHQWPSPELASEALDWFDLQAMRRRLVPPDSVLVARLFARDSTALARSRAAGQWVDAVARAREIVTDFGGLRDTGAAAAELRELADDGRVRAQVARAEALIEEGRRRDRRLFEYLDRVRAMRQPPRPGDAIRELDIRGLQRLRGGPDTARALAAGRALEQIFVAVSFYAPREFIARGDPERALAMLDVAESIRSEHPQVLLFRARALAAAGRFEEARAAVDAALRAGVTRQTIEGDSLLGPLVRPRRVP